MCNIEETIIKSFVVEKKQERIVWELNNPQKRENLMISRFPGISNFKAKCLYLLENPPLPITEQYLFHLGGVREVYFMGDDYIGWLSLKDAAQRAAAGEICIIYFGEGKGYYQGEWDYGSFPRYLLSTGDGSVCSTGK